ncbi:hypothetical protein THOM_2087 [Trachipleistophora hominis]|uniref:Uncharacterized protein n=1 Tax=Trachipleistophora hominis TaxID=72359 RepID=L7JV99_TRAHO|nr:hypothetical protein THOM_2087 [Trachipleistophora hominis]
MSAETIHLCEIDEMVRELGVAVSTAEPPKKCTL